MKKSIIIQTSLLAVSLCVPALYADDLRKPSQVHMQDRPGTVGASQPGATQQMTSQQFVTDAIKSGQKEVSLGELALQKSQDAKIKSFARDMVQDHSKANMELREIAQRKGLTVPGRDGWKQDTGSEDDQPSTTSGNDYTLNQPDRPVGPGSAPDSPAVGSEDRPQDTSRRTSNKDTADVDQANKEADKESARLNELSGVEFDRAYVKVMVSDHKKAVSKFDAAAKSLSDAELKAFASKTLPTLRTHLEHAQRLDRDYSTGTDEISSAK